MTAISGSVKIGAVLEDMNKVLSEIEMANIKIRTYNPNKGCGFNRIYH